MGRRTLLDDIEDFLFKPIAVTSGERWLVIIGCFTVGFLIGWHFL